MKLCTHSAGYTYTPSPSSTISTPRTFLTDGEAGLQIPTKMAQTIREWLGKMYPELAHLPFESTRMCWYTYSNDEDWVIDEVDGYKNLFVATAGSGHGFKVLAVTCMQFDWSTELNYPVSPCHRRVNCGPDRGQIVPRDRQQILDDQE